MAVVSIAFWRATQLGLPQQLLTVVTDLALGWKPRATEALILLENAYILGLVNSDNSFAMEVAQMYRTTNVKVLCTDSSLLQVMGLPEIELSSRVQEDDE